MGRIRVLDESTINKIAAGEVVERPASVVKELMENSMDSGASSVNVYVEDGGRRSIVVRDDGFGLSRDDVEKAFTRHATSKISDIDDLNSLSSYGFRGEALSSIASVSRIVLRTREHGSEEGTEARLVGGVVESISAAGCPPGTEITVTDLFFNVPVRRKSLRSRATELAHCKDVVIDYMLCRPGLSFTFHSDGRTELVHSPGEGMNGSLATAYGPRVAETIMVADADGDGIRIQSYVARLEQTRSSPLDLRLFVNDRPVRSSRLVSSVVRAFGSRLMKDRYPVGAIRIFVDGDKVDVNVHPTKREVRFGDEHAIITLLERCIESALSEPDLSFRYDLTKFSGSFEPSTVLTSSERIEQVQSILKIDEDGSHECKGTPHIVPLAQIMNTYILAESGGNLLLIDQHAASERVVYERVLESIRTGTEVSQRLLTPLVIRLTVSEVKVLHENRELVEKAGFDLESFGDEEYMLRSIPTVLGVSQGEVALRKILDDLSQMPSPKQLGLDVIWRVACHTAIRAGETLKDGQMRQLISDLMNTESPYTCEHGRPTMIVLSPADLERLFKRRV
ncbi:MAG: DNA mismatch repair endonuclease MutL [Candidatus Thermoplasmatota archaeon]|nr:DNA mismatch repair endonuclease MutL [Candidatus Thermoplasmatota archaeon]